MARSRTILSKAQIARELGISKARISQLIKRGLPVRKDGRIDREPALAWYRANVRERVRLPAPRLSEKTTAETVGPTGAELRAMLLAAGRAGAEDARREGSDFKAGLAYACRSLCTSVREQLPALLAGFNLPTQMPAGEGSVVTRIAVFAWVDFLLRAWSTDCFFCGRQVGVDVELPPIPWEAFGKHAAAMRRLYEIEIALLEGEAIPDDDEVLNIPDSFEAGTDQDSTGGPR